MKDHVWTASELLASVFLGPIPPIEDWRLAWYRSEDESEEIRSGVDVARKILILIRESGYEMEMEQIENNSFLPKECMETTNNDAFFASLTKHASHFENLLTEANAKDCRLKFVASFDNGKASVGLQFIPKESPFYNLEGKDNIVEFYTDRYIDQPLIIKGAGAGAAVTASGIFADVIRIGNV